MNTTPTDNTSVGDIWTTNSKKDMLLGLILILSAVGVGPFFGPLGFFASFITVLLVAAGIIMALIGYFGRP